MNLKNPKTYIGLIPSLLLAFIGYTRDYGDADLQEIGLDFTTELLLMLFRYWFIWLPALAVLLFLAWLKRKMSI